MSIVLPASNPWKAGGVTLAVIAVMALATVCVSVALVDSPNVPSPL